MLTTDKKRYEETFQRGMAYYNSKDFVKASQQAFQWLEKFLETDRIC